jgi:branched-chain amino acid transport system substrate-binding protein
MKKVFVVLVTVVLAGILVTPIPAPTAPPEIRIGANDSMSGPGAQWGISFTRGNEAGIDKINKEGGLPVGDKRYMIRFFKYDNKVDPATSVENTKMLIYTNKVNFIFHHAATQVLPALPITTENKIISIDVSSGDVTLAWPYNFNILVAPSFRSGISFQTWAKKFGIKKVAEVNPDTESGKNTQAVDRTSVKQQGIEMLSSLFYTVGTTDFYPILTKSLAVKPDMLVIGVGAPGDVPLIVKQARELGWTGPIGETLGAPPAEAIFHKIAGKAGDGFVWSDTSTSDPNFQTREQQEWMKYWKEHWPKDPFIPDSFNGCQQISILTQAVQKAGSLDPDKIVHVLETSDLMVLGWKLHFGVTPNCYQGRPRSLQSPLYLKTLKDGKEIVMDVLIPPGVEKVR